MNLFGKKKKNETKYEEFENNNIPPQQNLLSPQLPSPQQNLLSLLNELEEIKKQNESLKTLLEISERKNLSVRTPDINFKVLSELKIEQMVDELLQNENVNIKYLPDFVEKAIYKNVLNLTINLLSTVLSNAHVQMLGHQVTFQLNPVVNNEEV